MTREELAQRLAEADRARQHLRRATLELRKIGDLVLKERTLGHHRSERSDRSRVAGQLVIDTSIVEHEVARLAAEIPAFDLASRYAKIKEIK